MLLSTKSLEQISATVGRLTDLEGLPMPLAPCPSAEVLERVIGICRSVLFPGYYGGGCLAGATLVHHIGTRTERLLRLLEGEICAALTFEGRTFAPAEPSELAVALVERLPAVRELLLTDVEAAYAGDPAARSRGEVIVCYPATRALTCYRVAHELHRLGVPLIPRIIAETAHRETGIDIHPAASIGPAFSIDHGTGVVIGETCVIGRGVKIYQGVTLGARSFPLDGRGRPIKSLPRHPILGDDVIVYAGATILGRVTIGRGAVIGGNRWVTHDVPEGTRLTGDPLRPEAGAQRKEGRP